MTFKSPSWIRWIAILPVGLMAACSGAKLQSTDQTVQAITEGLHYGARQECQKNNVGMTEVMNCTRQVDGKYAQIQQSREIAKPAPLVSPKP